MECTDITFTYAYCTHNYKKHPQKTFLYRSNCVLYDTSLHKNHKFQIVIFLPSKSNTGTIFETGRLCQKCRRYTLSQFYKRFENFASHNHRKHSLFQHTPLHSFVACLCTRTANPFTPTTETIFAPVKLLFDIGCLCFFICTD